MGRPKGSKNKPKSIAKIPVENALLSAENHGENDSETMVGTPNTTIPTDSSQEEEEFDQNLHSNVSSDQQENSQTNQIDMQINQADVQRNDISETSTDTRVINRIGTFIFNDNDNLTPMFCKSAMLPNFPIRMTAKIKNAYKKALAKLCNKYVQQPNEINIFNILTIWKLVKTRKGEKEREMLENIKNIGEGRAYEMLSRLLNNMQLDDIVQQHDESADTEDFLTDKETKAIVNLIEKGHLSKAAKLLEKETKGIAEINATTLKEMIKLNPDGDINSFGNWKGPHGAIQEDPTILRKLVEDMNTQAAAGIDGWTAVRIKLSFGTLNDGDSNAQAFRNFLRVYYLSMANGTAPGKTMMLTSRGTPLIRTDMKLRPLSCGSWFYRLGAKYISTILGAEGLDQKQFGIGSKGGMEPIVEFIQQQIDACTLQTPKYLFEADGQNAFQVLKRSHIAKQIKLHAPQYWKFAKWILNEPAPLILSSTKSFTIISNSEGVRQGCPVAGYLYSLGMRYIVDELQKIGTENKTIAYMDNVFVVTDDANFANKAMDKITELKNQTGFTFKPSSIKCHNLWDVKNGTACITTSGFCIGHVNYRRELFENAIVKIQQIILRLNQLPSHHQLLILHQCISNKLKHLLRVMDCTGCDDQLKIIDDILYAKIDQLRNLEGDNAYAARDREIMGIARKDGGLGIYSHVDTKSLARSASLSNSRFELCQRNLSSVEFMVRLYEEQELQGRTGTENRYHAVGPTPPRDEENSQPIRQKVLMQEMLNTKLSKFLQSISEEDRTSFIDNTSITRALGAIPRGRKNLLLNNQVAANLNILLLKKKHDGDVCRCGCPNSTNHFETCQLCPNVSHNTHYRHNAIRDATSKAINQTTECNASIEPRVFATHPLNAENATRADILITRPRDINTPNHEFYGMHDFMVKAANSAHTLQERLKARAKATAQNLSDPIKIKHRELQAALEI